MRGYTYIIDTAVDKADPVDGYDIVKTEKYDSWLDARRAFDALPDPPKGTTFFLARVEPAGGHTTMRCKGD